MFVHKDKNYLKVKFLRFKPSETDDAGKERLGKDWNIPSSAIRIKDFLTLPEFKDEVPDWES